LRHVFRSCPPAYKINRQVGELRAVTVNDCLPVCFSGETLGRIRIPNHCNDIGTEQFESPDRVGGMKRLSNSRGEEAGIITEYRAKNE
jgi:hypothetical protein